MLYCLLITSSAITVQFLRKVERLHKKPYVDYYFCCNTVGRTLQWHVNSELVGHYGVEDAGHVNITSGNRFNCTSSLLSVEPRGQQYYAMLDSVLVISVEGNEIPLDVACTNTIRTNHTSNDLLPKYSEVLDELYTIMNQRVTIDYVVAAHIIQASSLLTHVFVCGTNGVLHQIGVDGEGVAFDLSDSVGRTRTIFYDNNNEVVRQQAILSSQGPYETTSLIFVNSNTNFSFSCATAIFEVQIQVFNSPFPTSVPDISATTTETTGLRSTSTWTGGTFVF